MSNLLRSQEFYTRFNPINYVITGTELSKKHIRKSSSNSKITTAASTVTTTPLNSSDSKVRTIEIKRLEDSSQVLQRSNSGSSDTSSGFGSLNNSELQVPTPSTSSTATADIIKSKLEHNNPMTKLQLLQERRNKLSSSENHHPSFANHFGFAARYRDQAHALMFPHAQGSNFHRNNLQRRIMTSVNNSNNKVAVSKSKSTIEYSKDSQTYR